MKASLFAFFIVLLCSTSHAVDLSVSYDIRGQAKLKWKKVDKYRHSVDCYTFGKGDDNSDAGSEEINRAISMNDVQGSVSMAEPSNFKDVSIGTVDFNVTHTVQDPFSETYSLSIADTTSWDDYRNIGDTSCNIHEYHWHVESNRISGQYTLKIKMPSDGWVLLISASTQGQATSLVGAKTSGDFHGVQLHNGNQFYVWAQPNSVVQIPFKIDFNSTGGLQGHLDLTIHRPGLSAAEDPQASLVKALQEVQQNKRNATLAFMNAGASIVGHTDVARKVVGQMGISPIRDLNRDLFKIANGSLPSNPDERHVKAMAAAVGYELALALLDDLKVFCETKAVYLPLTDQTVKRQGFIIAYFWISQSISQIEELQFPEIEAYLSEITRWENDGLKYSDIANDPIAFKKLSDSFIKIRQHSRLAWNVYGDLKGSIQKIVNTFGTAGSDPAAIQNIYQSLDQMSQEQAIVNRNFQNFILGFTKANTAPIDASSILRQLKSMESENDALSKQMNDVLKFYSIKVDANSSSVLDTMTESLANQVAIFEKPLTSPFIEPIRQSFARSEKVTQLEASYNKCLEVQ